MLQASHTQSEKPWLVVVAGPTAVGKTALCVQLAKHFHTEVVSADSRQFYKEMQIGTAKPTKEEMEEVPHHFVGHISITEAYDVGQYEQDALARITQLHRKNKVVILTGGSGLFLKAVCEGFDELPKVPDAVREQIRHFYEKHGLPALQEALQQSDETYYHEVDLQNPQRLMRALEVIRFTGKPFSSFRKGKSKPRSFQTLKIMLNRDRDELYERINQRMDMMLANGLVQEARLLLPYQHLNALQTVGYREFFAHWAGAYDWSETIRLLKQNSRRYAKRQLTWFRKDEDFTWFHPEEFENIVAFIEQTIQKNA